MKRAWCVVTLLALIASFAWGGWRGLAGITAGLIATGISVYGWWPAIRLLGRVAAEAPAPLTATPESDDAEPAKPTPTEPDDSEPVSQLSPAAKRLGTTYVIFLFLVKVPVFVALSLLARRVGGAAIPCFVAGIGLVYSALIGWGVSPDPHSL